MIQNIKNRKNIWGGIVPDLSNLSICDLHKVNPEIFPLHIIVIKNKNGLNKSSNYIVLKYDSKEVFVSALGKEDFYNKLFQKFMSNKNSVGKTMEHKSSNNELKTLERRPLMEYYNIYYNSSITSPKTMEREPTNNTLEQIEYNLSNNIRKKVEDAIISLKIIQFFGKNYGDYRKPFSKEFYELS
jgi:hypothetical protein